MALHDLPRAECIPAVIAWPWYIEVMRGSMLQSNTAYWGCLTCCASQLALGSFAERAAAGVGMCLLPNVVISAARRTLWPHDFQIIQARAAHSRPVGRSAPDKY